MREDPAHPREVPAIAATMASAQERMLIVIFGSPLFCARERCADLHIVVIAVLEKISPYVGKYIQFFLKSVPDIGHP